MPQQTTATFGNWVLRCVHPASGPQLCEVVQLVQQEGRAIAQMAIGSLGKDKPLRMTVVVQPNVSFAKKPVLAGPGKEREDVSFTWERCLPELCLADADVSEATLQRIRSWSQPARLSYSDAGGRDVELPLSPTGLPQALDALAKEDRN
ncbi:MAG: invasion associated locus B family protein [Acetobacteraceae bacterium]|nr:invasion associated locus B family protein [Acetobacteraceae bacterium]